MSTLRAEWYGEAVSANRRLMPGRAGRAWRPNPAYLAFKKALAYTLVSAKLRAGWDTTLGPVAVTLEVSLPARMDTEAVQKPCLDALELAGVVADDNQVVEVRTVRVGSGKPARIAFVVEER